MKREVKSKHRMAFNDFFFSSMKLLNNVINKKILTKTIQQKREILFFY